MAWKTRLISLDGALSFFNSYTSYKEKVIVLPIDEFLLLTVPGLDESFLFLTAAVNCTYEVLVCPKVVPFRIYLLLLEMASSVLSNFLIFLTIELISFPFGSELDRKLSLKWSAEADNLDFP